MRLCFCGSSVPKDAACCDRCGLEMARLLRDGDVALYQSPKYPDLAPYRVTIRRVNYAIAGSRNPYYWLEDGASPVWWENLIPVAS